MTCGVRGERGVCGARGGRSGRGGRAARPSSWQPSARPPIARRLTSAAPPGSASSPPPAPHVSSTPTVRWAGDEPPRHAQGRVAAYGRGGRRRAAHGIAAKTCLPLTLAGSEWLNELGIFDCATGARRALSERVATLLARKKVCAVPRRAAPRLRPLHSSQLHTWAGAVPAALCVPPCAPSPSGASAAAPAPSPPCPGRAATRVCPTGRASAACPAGPSRSASSPAARSRVA
eukprot:4008262-Prymnesium_polylepis.1